MATPAIQAEGLGKRYRIGVLEQRHDTMAGAVLAWLRSPLDNYRRLRSLSIFRDDDKGDDVVWALRDLSFEVAEGEIVGVIGRNGAGKTTLLKLLSRITTPSSGRAVIRGRVSSLLEVGTGFHPELTGRENIFLNGTVLGMSRHEISRKLDEIVDFSGVERFIDTPVKRYSSGMKVRLAFAVAAHLEPEILLIDEVLAVGDLEFQRKCIGKMEGVARMGRTVLFVSHHLGLVRSLCESAIVLDQGRLCFRGDIAEGVACYAEMISGTRSDDDGQPAGSGWSRITINGQPAGLTGSLAPGTAVEVGAELVLEQALPEGGRLYCIVDDAHGRQLIHELIDVRSFTAGAHRIRVGFPPLWLAPGPYSLYLKLWGRSGDGREARHLSEAVLLDISGTRTGGAGKTEASLVPETCWSVSASEPEHDHGG